MVRAWYPNAFPAHIFVDSKPPLPVLGKTRSEFCAPAAASRLFVLGSDGGKGASESASDSDRTVKLHQSRLFDISRHSKPTASSKSRVILVYTLIKETREKM